LTSGSNPSFGLFHLYFSTRMRFEDGGPFSRKTSGHVPDHHHERKEDDRQ